MEATINPISITPASKKVLLIEDDFFILDLYKSFLETAGFEVDTMTEGGHDVLQRVQEINPAVILLDIMLPVLNGIEVLKELKSDPNTRMTPVVLISNLGHQDIINEAFRIGAQGYLLKVRSSAKEIVSTVQTFIENPSYRMDIPSE